MHCLRFDYLSTICINKQHGVQLTKVELGFVRTITDHLHAATAFFSYLHSANGFSELQAFLPCNQTEG